MNYSEYGLDEKKASEDTGSVGESWCLWCNGHYTKDGFSMCFSNWIICKNCLDKALDLTDRWKKEECWKCQKKDVSCFITVTASELGLCKECVIWGKDVINNQKKYFKIMILELLNQCTAADRVIIPPAGLNKAKKLTLDKVMQEAGAPWKAGKTKGYVVSDVTVLADDFLSSLKTQQTDEPDAAALITGNIPLTQESVEIKPFNLYKVNGKRLHWMYSKSEGQDQNHSYDYIEAHNPEDIQWAMEATLPDKKVARVIISNMDLKHQEEQDLVTDERLPFLDTTIEVNERKCRVCGCTENNCAQCINLTGGPCHWVNEDLCSACEVVKETPVDKIDVPVNFFSEILPLLKNVPLRFEVKIVGVELEVAVLPLTTSATTNLIINGTAKEFDEGFMAAISGPISKIKIETIDLDELRPKAQTKIPMPEEKKVIVNKAAGKKDNSKKKKITEKPKAPDMFADIS